MVMLNAPVVDMNQMVMDLYDMVMLVSGVPIEGILL